MHLYKTIKTFLFDKDYFINFFENHIHLYGFLDIVTLEEEIATFHYETFDVQLLGSQFRVLKLTKNEILLKGEVKEMKIT